jgi:hypothetical protein
VNFGVRPLPRLYDSADDLAFDDEQGEPLAAAVPASPAPESYVRELDTEPELPAYDREAREVVTELRAFFASVVDELEDAFADTQPFVRGRS